MPQLVSFYFSNQMIFDLLFDVDTLIPLTDLLCYIYFLCIFILFCASDIKSESKGKQRLKMEEIPKHVDDEQDEPHTVNLRTVTAARQISGRLFEAIYDTNQNSAARLKDLYPRQAYQVVDLPEVGPGVKGLFNHASLHSNRGNTEHYQTITYTIGLGNTLGQGV